MLLSEREVLTASWEKFVFSQVLPSAASPLLHLRVNRSELYLQIFVHFRTNFQAVHIRIFPKFSSCAFALLQILAHVDYFPACLLAENSSF